MKAPNPTPHMQPQTDNQIFTTSGVLLDSDGFETNTGVWAFIQDGLLIVNATPYALWDVRIFDNRIVSKVSGWTLLF